VLLDSDHPRFAGSGVVNPPVVAAEARPHGVFAATLTLDLPPLGLVLLRAPAV
jgi:hypothetical protein